MRATAEQTHRFAALLDRCERLRPGGMPFDELRELSTLYRLHASRLARLRERDTDPEALRHLNALCVRGYTFLYTTAADAAAAVPAMHRLARALAQTWQAQVLAWLLLATGMLAGGVLAGRDPEALAVLVPDAMGYSADMLDELVASPAARTDFLAGRATHPAFNAVFSSYLFVRNTRVGLLAFATGILAGVPTVLLQLYNGILLGAFASIFLHGESILPFLAWILPHGIPELTAITLCAAAGLLLGRAVATPGRVGRGAALRAAMEPALLLFGCAVPLFAIAAALESFVRESPLGTTVRLLFAGIVAVGVVTALVQARRLSRRFHVDTGWLQELSARDRIAAPSTGSVPPP